MVQVEKLAKCQWSVDILINPISILFIHLLLGCIECMRCRLLLPMFAVSVKSVCPSVCLSVTNAPNDPGSASLCGVIGGDACSVRRVPCARGHSVQPSPNAFGLLLFYTYCTFIQDSVYPSCNKSSTYYLT